MKFKYLELHPLNEMKITTEPYPYEFTKKGRIAEGKFFSTETNDHYLVDFSPYRKNETVVEFSSNLLKSDLYSKSSPKSVAKIISTVFSMMLKYLESEKESILTFTGSDEKRTRVYGLLLRSNPIEGLHWKEAKDGGYYIALKTTDLVYESTFRNFEIDLINEMKLTVQKPYSFDIVSVGGDSEASFISTETNDKYKIRFIKTRKEVIVDFSSEVLKLGLNGKMSIMNLSKIISTVFSCMYKYLQNNPSAILYFVGTDEKRTRVYREFLRDNPLSDIHWKDAKDGGIYLALRSQELLLEEWSTEAPVGPDLSFLPESVIESLVPNFLTKRPPVGTLTVEDDKEVEQIRKAQKNLTESDYRFIKECNDSPPDVYYTWLTKRGQKVNMSELKSMWMNENNLKVTKALKECYSRNRPYETYEDVKLAPGTYVGDKSFPSGHSIGAFYMASKLSEKFPHLREGLFALAHEIGDSRVKAGAHYPSDVEAGKAIGLALAQK